MASRIPSALFVLFLVVPSGLIAQQEEADRHFSAGAGVGLTTPVGNQSGKLDRAIHFEAGGGYFFNSHLGVTGNFLFTSPDVSAAELTRLSQISGSTNIIAITIDPTYRLRVTRNLSVYVFGGGGYLRRRTDLTHASTAQTVTIGGTQVTLDPGFGFFGPAQGTGSPITVRTTEGAGAFDAGAGINVPIPKTKLQMFVEGRYVQGFTGTSNTTLLPVTVGIRW